jgi:hypothetical protein
MVVRNLPLPFIEVISLGARSSSIPVDLEPVVLAYHQGELVVPAPVDEGDL